MFGQRCQVKASYGKALEENVFKGKASKVTHVRARHDMVKQVSSRLVMTRHVMVWKVG
jgi:hypothetical protein